MPYPSSLDSLANPASTDLLTNPSHADQHANANNAIELIEAYVGLSGASFPGSPTTNDRFLRTDRQIEYYYDGTRWVSTTLYTGTFPYQRTTNPVSISGVWDVATVSPDYSIYVYKFFLYAYVETTNDVTNYWTFDFGGTPALNSANVGPNTWNLHTVNVNAVKSGQLPAFTYALIGGAGSAYLTPAFTYRLIG